MKTGCVILAAGSSSRMGKSKLLLPVHGTPLLVYTIKKITSQDISPILIVLGSDSEKHRNSIQDQPVEVVVNDEWSTGMGSSIRKGLTDMIRFYPELDAILVVVSDQPMIPPTYYSKLISTASVSPKKILASSYASTIGVPVLIKKEALVFFEAIENQHGAKRILETHSSEVETLNCAEGGMDVDTPSDYEKLLREIDRQI